MKSLDLPQLEVRMLREILRFLRPSEERQVWLVGGSIRDLLRGSTTVPDLDLATSFNPIGFAREFARATGAGFVVLDDERHVVRVVSAVKGSHYTFDISEFRAPGIDDDLRARDFTINSIAAPLFGSGAEALKDGRIELYDPLGGIEDLAAGRIEPSSDRLFTDDPLRLMRAFRFSALFNAEFSSHLHQMIVSQASLLKEVSGERIRDELFKVLGVADSARWVRIMDSTGILAVILPQLHACHGVEQNEWHHLDVFEHTLLTLENIEKQLLIDQPFGWWHSFMNYLNETVSGARTYAQNLKLGCLLHDLGKPPCRRYDSEARKTIFHGHEMEGSNLARDIGERLRLSLNEIHYLQKLVKNHMRPGVMLQQGLNDKRLFRFYSETGRDGLGIALLSLADRYSALGSLGDTELAEFTAGIFQIMHQFYEQLKRPNLPPFLNGNDLIRHFKLKPGPEFRRILETLEEAQFTGEITTRDEALTLAETLLKQ
ncbi:MAG: HD domain-containing protein [Candidatus Riflebacteria bacterium]|nr:HD domain-containing protein [Candidatus Riflebacteria bacterium]